MDGSENQVSNHRPHRSWWWRASVIAGVVLSSLVSGIAVGVTLSPAADDGSGGPTSIGEVETRIEAVGATDRQDRVVEGIVEAARDGCSVVLKIGHASQRDGSDFRRATRVLTHGFAAFHDFDRVTSTIARTDDGLVGVIYGERCIRAGSSDVGAS
jgi:hypothetical protein